MARGYGGRWIHVDPFHGLAVSVKTSNIVSTRYAFDITLSYYTNSGTTSTLTWCVSNATGNPQSTSIQGSGNTPSTMGIPEASWSQWTSFGSFARPHAASHATTLDPPLGYRWARIMREASGASFVFDVNKLER